MASEPVPPGASVHGACPAKVNLLLRVLAREASGYHQLETLFCALELADSLEVAAGEEPGIELETDMAGDPAQNLVVLAARAFCEAAGIPAAHRIRLEKRIPAGAGLGGGSSDAATTLAAMNSLHGRPLADAALLRLAATLGSDVPFFAANVPLALAWGRGHRLLALPPLERRPVLLAVPGFAIATADAYAGLAASRRAAADEGPARYDLARFATWDRVAAIAGNDFEPVTFASYPELAEIKDALGAAGARIALLSGSGSVVFGVFDTDADRDVAATRLENAFPDLRWLRTATRFRPEPPRAGFHPG